MNNHVCEVNVDAMRIVWNKNVLLSFALLGLVLLVCYWPCLKGDFVWDDQEYVAQNRLLTSVDGLRQIWFHPGATDQYYPLVFTAFWVQYHFWGLHPVGYHVVNILLHGLNAILVWRVLRRLNVPGAYLAAAFFALHPVHVESVAWMTELKNTLSGAFFLLAMWTALEFWCSESVSSGRGSWKYYVLALILFTCALLSKTAVCMFPVVLLLILWWKKERLGWRDVALVAPLLVVAVGLGLLTVWVEQIRCGAVGARFSFTLAQRIVIAGQAVWFYLYSLFWPMDLSPIYPRWNVAAIAKWQYLFPVGVVALIVLLWFSRKWVGKGLLVAALFFVLMLLPVLGFVNVSYMNHSFVADHFQYIPSLGPLAIAASLIVTALGRLNISSRFAETVVAVVVLVVLAPLTWRQAGAYRNLETFSRCVLQKNPDSWASHNNLGYALCDQGKTGEAISHFSEALRLNPQYPEAYNNMGTAFVQEGKIGRAIDCFEKALAMKPSYFEARYNLANMLAEQKKYGQAVRHFEEILKVAPRFAEAHYYAGLALMNLGRWDESLAHFSEASRLDPSNGRAEEQIASIRARKNRIADDMNLYQTMLKVEPKNVNAHFQLGKLLEEQGKAREAIDRYRQAIDLARSQGKTDLARTIENQLEQCRIRQDDMQENR